MKLAGNLYDTREPNRERPMPSNSFERFYYEKVALSEGCGCAEQIIGTRDLEARAHEAAVASASESSRGGRIAWLARLFRRRGHGQDPLKSES